MIAAYPIVNIFVCAFQKLFEYFPLLITHFVNIFFSKRAKNEIVFFCATMARAIEKSFGVSGHDAMGMTVGTTYVIYKMLFCEDEAESLGAVFP